MFGAFCAVRDLSFNLEKEEIMAILGPSGCGKSTLLRMLAGFEKPDQGDICLEGRDVFRSQLFLPPEKRNIGMVFQDLALFPHLNVFENIAFGLRSKNRRKLEGESLKNRVVEMLTLVGLPDYEKKMPNTLSGGEQQRVALARALATNPGVLLLDEPFSGLDAKLRGNLRREMKKMLKRNKTSVLLVTHDQEEAFSFADRIMVMNEGKLVQTGSARELYENPRNPWVASFVGEANFFNKKEILSLLTKDSFLYEKMVNSTKEVFAVRPHQFSLKRLGDNDQNIKGSIKACDYLGEKVLYHVSIPKKENPILIQGMIGETFEKNDKVALCLNHVIELSN
jgi:iron(III) transport system ATP-binding protein